MNPLKKTLGIILSVCVLCLLWACPKEVGAFQGKVSFIDINSGEAFPASGAEISIYPYGGGNQTQAIQMIEADLEGSYYLEVYESGEYRISATYSVDSISYSYESSLLYSDGKRTNKLDLVLMP